MSLREDLLFGLKEHKTWRVDVDREKRVKGRPAIGIVIWTITGKSPHEFTFSEKDQMTTQHMLSVIKTHLRNRI